MIKRPYCLLMRPTLVVEPLEEDFGLIRAIRLISSVLEREHRLPVTTQLKDKALSLVEVNTMSLFLVK